MSHDSADSRNVAAACSQFFTLLCIFPLFLFLTVFSFFFLYSSMSLSTAGQKRTGRYRPELDKGITTSKKRRYAKGSEERGAGDNLFNFASTQAGGTV